MRVCGAWAHSRTCPFKNLPMRELVIVAIVIVAIVIVAPGLSCHCNSRRHCNSRHCNSRPCDLDLFREPWLLHLLTYKLICRLLCFSESVTSALNLVPCTSASNLSCLLMSTTRLSSCFCNSVKNAKKPDLVHTSTSVFRICSSQIILTAC